MPEKVRECMERIEQVLPDMTDVLVARLTGYAEGYADRAEQEAKQHDATEQAASS